MQCHATLCERVLNPIKTGGGGCLTFVRVEKHGPKIAKNHKNPKNKGTFTLTTLKGVRVKVKNFPDRKTRP